MKELVKQLVEEFADKDYAHAYMQNHTLSRISAQIHALRQQRGLSQKELATAAGISQERVCKLERGDFDSLTLKTLWKFSEAFDTNLHVTFSSFSDGILDVANLTAEKLKVPPRESDINNMKDKTILPIHRHEWQFVEKDCPFVSDDLADVATRSTREVPTNHPWERIAA